MADEVSNGKVLDISAKMFKMEKESYLILDCREENEYEISHIKNARRVGFDDFNSSQLEDCLLYTSDAADERSSVDLGGRRIIKKKKS